MSYYILDDNKIPIPVDAFTWGKWLSDNNDKRRVGLDTLENGTFVSTVFVGISTYMMNEELYETLVHYGDKNVSDEVVMKYNTWTEAEKGHNIILESLGKSKEIKKKEPKKRKVINRFELLDI